MRKISEYQKILSDNKGKTFFQREDEKKFDKAHDDLLDRADKSGLDNAKKITEAALNPAHADHAKALEMFAKYPSSNLHKKCVEDAREKLKVRPRQEKDTNYEQKVKNGYKIHEGGKITGIKYKATNAADAAILDSFRKTISAKHDAVGYDSDPEDVATFFKKYPISQFKNTPGPDGTQTV